MSLVISKNGKIQSYYHKENTSVTKMSKSNTSSEVQDFDEFSIEGKLKSPKHKPNQQAFNSYSKVETGVKKTHSRIFVKDIMNSPVFTFECEKTLAQASADMKKFKKRHYPIVQENTIVGIISERDILTARSKHFSPSTPLNDIMSNEVILVKEDTDIRIVCKIMIEENISSLPVINDNDLLIGIITKTDLLKCIIHNMPIDCLI